MGQARGFGLLPMTIHFQTASNPTNQRTSASKVDECTLIIVHYSMISTHCSIPNAQCPNEPDTPYTTVYIEGQKLTNLIHVISAYFRENTEKPG
ncbi:hypothetical protein [Paenibacillus amylolyticus]|uniref:hypothetical protein n=1 Tax=Paenibacillus amylolyticus TaxID=1451 RepID=UPI00344C1BD5